MLTYATKLFLIVALSLTGLANTPTRSNRQDEVIRVETNLVTVPAIVKKRSGAYIPNLERKDFHIYEDGVEQEISHFEAADKPFTVILMLDASDSTNGQLQDIQAAALAFIDQLYAEDRGIIVGFDKQMVRMTEPTNDRQLLIAAVRSAKTGGGTALYDAVTTVINSKHVRSPGRTAIVLLTDGIDTSSSNSTYDNTLALAAEQYAFIYPIQYNTVKELAAKTLNDSNFAVTYTTPSGEPLSKAYERGTRYLQTLARISGGRFHYADEGKSLSRAFASIAQELRQQYTLSYYPKNQKTTNGKRRIKVEVDVPDAVVHARETYVYKPRSR
jgi:VWFA-related protein